MTLKRVAEFTGGSLSALAYQTATAQIYAQFDPGAKTPGFYVRGGTLSGAGNLKIALAHIPEDPNSGVFTPTPFALASVVAAAASSISRTHFMNNSLTALLPYGTLKVQLENTGGTTATLSNFIAQLLADIS